MCEKGRKTELEHLKETEREKGEVEGEKYRNSEQPQTLFGRLTFIMSVGSQNAVGDLSQSAEKPRALPEA